MLLLAVRALAKLRRTFVYYFMCAFDDAVFLIVVLLTSPFAKVKAQQEI